MGGWVDSQHPDMRELRLVCAHLLLKDEIRSRTDEPKHGSEHAGISRVLCPSRQMVCLVLVVRAGGHNSTCRHELASALKVSHHDQTVRKIL